MFAMVRDQHLEPIMTAPHDQGRELLVITREGRTHTASWWRHWSMPKGVWWSWCCGVIDPVWWWPE